MEASGRLLATVRRIDEWARLGVKGDPHGGLQLAATEVGSLVYFFALDEAGHRSGFSIGGDTLG